MHEKIAAHDLFATPNRQFHLAGRSGEQDRLLAETNFVVQHRSANSAIYSTSYRQIDVKPASRTVRDARLDEFFAALKRANH
jgi:hypothetical protein